MSGVRYTLDSLKKAFIADGRGFVLRDWNSFTKVRDKHHLVCPKHPSNDWHSSIHPILSKRHFGCPICSQELAANRYREPVESIQKRLMELGFELVGKYSNMNTPVEIKHIACGKSKKYKLGNVLITKQGCLFCSGHARLTKPDVVERLAEFELLLISEYSGSLVDKHDILCRSCGHIRNVSLVGPVRKGGCPACAKYGFAKHKNARVYYVYGSNNFGEFYKIGITNRKTEHRNKQTFTTHKILWEFDSDGYNCYNIEQAILKNFSTKLVKKSKFSGSTECFTEDIRNHINLDKFVSTFKES